MKLLLDMNLPQPWIAGLAAAGHEVTHWRHVGDRRAADTEIMAYARLHLAACADALNRGALVSIDVRQARVRLLPFRSKR